MEQSTSQKHIFLSGEGDSWYNRNLLHKPDSQSLSYDVECIIEFCKAPAVGEVKRVLEIGCSDGTKLNTLAKHFNAVGFGIDPSASAISDGMKRYNSSHINLSVGTSDTLPYEDESFDLVFVGFCLYLVDRNQLSDTFNSINRVLRRGGVVAITDFDVIEPVIREYHHVEGVKTYKCDYPSMLVQAFNYHLGYKSSYSHHSNLYTNDVQERIAISILYKP